MPIFANNIIVNNKKLEVKPPAPKNIDPPKRVVNIPVEPITEEETPKYHNVKEGELEKLINTQSTYLTDMLGLEKNK